MKNLRPFAWTVIVLSVCTLAGYTPAPSPPLSPLPPSSAISHFVAINLINSTNSVIADLASMNSDGLDHQIKITSKGRILASAQVGISNPAGIAVRGACDLWISDGTGPTNGLTMLSPRSAIWFTTANAAYNLTVPIVGYATKSPGTYNVVVQCQQLAATGATNAQLNNMIVWQAAE